MRTCRRSPNPRLQPRRRNRTPSSTSWSVRPGASPRRCGLSTGSTSTVPNSRSRRWPPIRRSGLCGSICPSSHGPLRSCRPRGSRDCCSSMTMRNGSAPRGSCRKRSGIFWREDGAWSSSHSASCAGRRSSGNGSHPHAMPASSSTSGRSSSPAAAPRRSRVRTPGSTIARSARTGGQNWLRSGRRRICAAGTRTRQGPISPWP